MSNFLAIATVTATLKLEVLQDAVETAVPGADVTIARPDGISGSASGARVNLYLYQVTPNVAWRSNDLPTRNANGQLVQRPRVALDLFYLLTFYGDESQLVPQRMLGSVALAMHAKPVLTRDMIRNTIVNTSFSFLAQSNLADEIELIKFTPLPLSLEELSKLWSVFFQTQYVLSMAYQATVVLIEGEETPRAALPVREPMIYTMPFRHPSIERIRSQAGENEPIVAGSTLIIEGQQLRGTVTQLRIGGSDLMMLQDAGDTQIVFSLTSLQPAGSLRAGVQAVQIVQPAMMGQPPTAHVGIESNVFPLVVHPTIVASHLSDPTHLTIDVDLAIGKTQRVLLLLNETESQTQETYVFVAEPRARFEITAETLKHLKAEGVPEPVLDQLATINKGYMREKDFWDAVKQAIGDQQTASFGSLILKYAGPDAGNMSITFHIAGVKTAKYLVRIQVDGAESLLQIDRDKDSPTFKKFIDPKVTIP